MPGSDGFDLEDEERDEDGHTDDAWYETYRDELLTRFLQSAEGQGLDPALEWAATFMEIARDKFDKNLAYLTEEEIAWSIFDEMANTVDCTPDDAQAITTETRQFWRFLAREHEVENARGALHVLKDGAAEILADCIENAMSEAERAGSSMTKTAAAKKKAAEVAKRRAKTKAKKKARPKHKK